MEGRLAEVRSNEISVGEIGSRAIGAGASPGMTLGRRVALQQKRALRGPFSLANLPKLHAICFANL